MFARMVITLDSVEHAALIRIAAAEYREPQAQLRYLLRTEAERRGLALAETHHNTEAPALSLPQQGAGARTNP